ncbi:zf-HC2 domain-containing protein [Myxococcus stipitatus]|uniref:zf-HC2 domain-containing protein n=1 Tax=Myxococcus stipitatus TaxID=83455 RepID=UPI001F231672|nr:zf-HC2 domain-containing protein [Myxococcus stipitatus]MCE9672744.1 zf-HC2 domain-containing protein [Myxococcus stipitatus]
MKPQNLHAHEDRLLDFAYGELATAEAQAVEAHLQGCTRCTQALADIRGVRLTMAHLSTEAAPDTGLDSLLAYAQQSARRAAAGPAPAPSRWRRWLLPVLGVACVAMLGLFVLRPQAPAHEAALDALSTKDVRRKHAEAVPQEARAPAAPAVASASPPTLEESAKAVDANVAAVAMNAPEPRAKSERDDSRRADGWENAGSGGGVGPGTAMGKSKAYRARKEASSSLPSGAAVEKALGDEEALVGKGSFGGRTAVAEVQRESLRLGGSAQRAEALGSQDDQVGAGAKDRELEAPALEVAEAPRRAPAPPPSPANASADEAEAEGRGASEAKVDFAQAQASRVSAAPKPSKKQGSSRDDVLGAALSASAPTPPASVAPVRDEDTSAPSVEELSARARVAQRAGDRAQEAGLLRLALSAGASGTERLELLNRLCDAEFALGRRQAGRVACNQVLSEAPGSSEARVARSRLMRHDTDSESPAEPSQRLK